MIKKLACTLAFALPLAMAQSTANSPSEIEQLKQMLLDQQKQINELKIRLGMAVNRALGEVASTKPMVPATASEPASTFSNWAPPAGTSSGSASQINQNPRPDEPGPLQLKLGDAYFTPIGFMDMTSVTRSTNPGSGIGTNFGSIPYSNTQAGALSESRFSVQNSRIGLKVDTMFHDYKVTGWWESDFLGQLGSPPNGGLAVSSNPYVFRLRLFWVDVQKGHSEFLAGQTWSLMTPGKTGISPIPNDIFYSQDVDVNYQAGLVWGRIPEFRYVYHASDKVHFALALDNSEPYVGGANGGSGVTLPAAISTTATTGSTQGSVLGGQINNGSSVISSAALMPDIIAKLAFDPTNKFHIEFAGVMIANKIAYPMTGPTFPTNTDVGGGGSVNLNFELAKGFRIYTNNYWSDGGGRYIFGQAPDFMIRANGTASLIHSGSTVSGFEYITPKNTFYAYYGGVYIAKNMALDANGTTKIGYGSISSDGQNRAIQEFTVGTNTTLAKSPSWGALNLMMQYSYLQRDPWLVTGTAPTNASLSMGFVNLRYTLPLYSAWSRLGKN